MLTLLFVIVLAGQSTTLEHASRAAGSWLRSHGTVGIVLFVTIGVPAIAVGLPRQAFAFAAGLAWGFLPGALAALIVALGGSTLAFELSRRRLAGIARYRLPRTIALMSRVAAADGFRAILALRLQPFGTNLMTNLAAGMSPLPRGRFVLASALGFVPQTIVFVLLGDGLRIASNVRVGIAVAAALVSVGLGALVVQRLRVAQWRADAPSIRRP